MSHGRRICSRFKAHQHLNIILIFALVVLQELLPLGRLGVSAAIFATSAFFSPVAQTHSLERFESLFVHRTDFFLLNVLFVALNSLGHPERGVNKE